MTQQAHTEEIEITPFEGGILGAIMGAALGIGVGIALSDKKTRKKVTTSASLLREYVMDALIDMRQREKKLAQGAKNRVIEAETQRPD